MSKRQSKSADSAKVVPGPADLSISHSEVDFHDEKEYDNRSAISDQSNLSASQKDLLEQMKSFEFTNGFFMMRLIRTIVYLQVIAIAIANPSIQLPPTFTMVFDQFFLYLQKWYSRPFLDIVILVQYWSSTLQEYFDLLAQSRVPPIVIKW